MTQDKCWQLEGSVLTTSEITCHFCKHTQTEFNCDEYEAIREFYKDGWRLPKTNVYCPKCAKKKLKKQTK